VIGTFLLCYLGLVGSYLFLLWYAGPVAAEGFLRYRDVFLVTAAAGYGFFRVWWLHPVFHAKYHRWLSIVPWSHERPLPLGPVHLSWQDPIVLAVLVAMLHQSFLSPWLVPLLAMIAYLATLAVALLLSTQPWHAYLTLFGIGLAVLNLTEPLAVGLILASTYLVGYAGLLRSLRRFPWPYTEQVSEAVERSMNQGAIHDYLGWPYDQLSPKRPKHCIAYSHGLAISALAGWYTYVVTAVVPPQVALAMIGMFGPVLLLAALITRVAIYLPHCRGPISFWGRLLTLRWIIPRHDQVFAAPLLMILPAGLFTALAAAKWLTPQLAAAFGITAVLAIALNLGPSLARWQLTGGQRIHPQMSGAMPRELIKL
jgi:hypothetical protein